MTNQERLQQNNEKIEAIQQTLASKANIDVEAINNRITALETKDVELQNKDTEIESNISTLNSSVDSINTSLEEVIDTVNNLPTGGKVLKVESLLANDNATNMARISELFDKIFKIVIKKNGTTLKSVYDGIGKKLIFGTDGSLTIGTYSSKEILYANQIVELYPVRKGDTTFIFSSSTPDFLNTTLSNSIMYKIATAYDESIFYSSKIFITDTEWIFYNNNTPCSLVASNFTQIDVYYFE